jgi:hypothetical protein
MSPEDQDLGCVVLFFLATCLAAGFMFHIGWRLLEVIWGA